MKRLLTALTLAPIRAYQRWISPLFPQRCKYHPSCSTYAIDAVRELGVLRGTVLAAWRLVRCNPWSKGGIDPIENRRFFRDHGHPSEGIPKQAGERGTPA